MLTDSFGRKITYLRLSVTDRCNFRCVYCLPEIYSRFSPLENVLTDDEIVRLISLFANLGLSRVRITGGEPLLRPGIVDLVDRLHAIPGISDLSLSTNGFLLKKMASDLARAGLSRVNISLDSLKPERFEEITRFGTFNDVWEGIQSAQEAGLSPIKINAVVMKGINEDEIPDFVALTEKNPFHVRFIELMPMGETGFFTKDRWLPYDKIRELAGPLEELPLDEKPVGFGPAHYFRRPGARGTVGIISALSCGFCSSCNRVRLTSTGTLVPCLDAMEGTDLKSALRKGSSDQDVLNLIQQTIQKKPEHHFMGERTEGKTSNARFMCQVGG
ncbi:MAG: GTP 3',8-cyclase [Elusimicrobia bacterium]|nr:GTP 3',8-cyclase [Elusimicrobiota bacterium]